MPDRKALITSIRFYLHKSISTPQETDLFLLQRLQRTESRHSHYIRQP